jgi:hypothetical protein
MDVLELQLPTCMPPCLRIGTSHPWESRIAAESFAVLFARRLVCLLEFSKSMSSEVLRS